MQRSNSRFLPVLYIVGVMCIGFLSSFLSGDMNAIYYGLTKPPLAPPAWLFGVVWPILYGLMGYAAYLVHRDGGADKGQALFWFWIQLLVNFVWSPVFFRFQLFWAAAMISIVLVCLVFYTMRLFRAQNPTAGRLLLPYLLWLLFATYLSFGVALLN